MFASNSSTEVGVVSNGELDGDDNSPVVVKTVQVGTHTVGFVSGLGTKTRPGAKKVGIWTCTQLQLAPFTHPEAVVLPPSGTATQPKNDREGATEEGFVTAKIIYI